MEVGHGFNMPMTLLLFPMWNSLKSLPFTGFSYHNWYVGSKKCPGYFHWYLNLILAPVYKLLPFSLRILFCLLFRLIPSTSDLSDSEQSATPVPAPPPGYESRDPGFAPITDADTQLLPPPCISNTTTSKKSHQDVNNQCSTTMTTTTTNADLESRL